MLLFSCDSTLELGQGAKRVELSSLPLNRLALVRLLEELDGSPLLSKREKKNHSQVKTKILTWRNKDGPGVP